MLKTIICPKCCKPYDESLSECPFCARYGSRLSDAAEEAVKPPEVKEKAPKMPFQLSRSTSALLIAAALIVVLALAAGLLSSGAKNPAPDTSLSEVEEEPEQEQENIKDQENHQDENQTAKPTEDPKEDTPAAGNGEENKPADTDNVSPETPDTGDEDTTPETPNPDTNTGTDTTPPSDNQTEPPSEDTPTEPGDTQPTVPEEGA